MDADCKTCKKDYAECRRCSVYVETNTPCALCSRIGKRVKPFVKASAKGFVKLLVCSDCMVKHL